MNTTTPERKISWFGKLPCVGDFCSHNMSATVCETLDKWLSEAMQHGQETHGSAWTRAYFQTPMHGFVWGSKVIPELQETWVVGVIMPSVDKVGRAFPFVLLELLPTRQSLDAPDIALGMDELAQWFSQAYSICATAMNDEWTLDRLCSELHRLPEMSGTAGFSQPVVVPAGHSEWYRIEFNGRVNWAMQCAGLPRHDAFDLLMGMGKR